MKKSDQIKLKETAKNLIAASGGSMIINGEKVCLTNPRVLKEVGKTILDIILNN